MERERRVRRSESAWREIVARQAASGRPVDGFCRDEGLSRSVFTRWRSRLAGSASTVAARRARPRPTSFVEVGELSSGTARTIRLELGAGIVLTISR